jgi:hypothetical protein
MAQTVKMRWVRRNMNWGINGVSCWLYSRSFVGVLLNHICALAISVSSRPGQLYHAARPNVNKTG